MRKLIWFMVFWAVLISTAGMGICAEQAAECTQLTAKVENDLKRYSINADVDGFFAYDNILCGVELRAKKLCATELSVFDSSARVYDFDSAEELEVTKAHYCINPTSTSIKGSVCFKDKAAAEKFVAEHGGQLVNYDQLVDGLINGTINPI